MSDRSAIEWTEATWNPVTGCDKLSPGCAHCYAETFAKRFQGVPGHPYEQGFELKLWPERLGIPLGWRRPRMVFVNSVSDLFHERIPEEFVAEVFEVMREASQHTFQVLTKRHERLAQVAPELPWPDNVWMGVTIENRRFVLAKLARRLPEGSVWIAAVFPAGQVTVPASRSMVKSRLPRRSSLTVASGTGASTSMWRSASSARTGPLP